MNTDQVIENIERFARNAPGYWTLYYMTNVQKITGEYVKSEDAFKIIANLANIERHIIQDMPYEDDYGISDEPQSLEDILYGMGRDDGRPENARYEISIKQGFAFKSVLGHIPAREAYQEETLEHFLQKLVSKNVEQAKRSN